MQSRWFLVLTALIVPQWASAELPKLPVEAPGRLCRPAVLGAERSYNVPSHLLAAIAHVESGRRDPASGAFDPWPWTINADGQSYFYDTKAEAIAAVHQMQARGIRSIDVGCMQISLLHHPDAFASLEQAFDPTSNANYGARFLNELHDKTNSWPKAVELYHSATPEFGEDYGRRVYAALPEEQRLAGIGPWDNLDAGWSAMIIRPHFSTGFRTSMGRIIPMPSAGQGQNPVGRTLDVYRLAPVRLAFHAP